MLTNEELDHLDKSIHCLRLELPKAVADDALPPLHRLVQEHRESLSRRAADDGEAVAHGWLMQQGFDRHDGLAKWFKSMGKFRLEVDEPLIGGAWLVCAFRTVTGLRIPLVAVTTRGQLRRLLDALGGKS